MAMAKWYDNKPIVMASNFFGDISAEVGQKLTQFLMVLHPEMVKPYDEAIGSVICKLWLKCPSFIPSFHPFIHPAY